MTASMIGKAPPFSLPFLLTSTLIILNYFPTDAAAAGTVEVGKVGTLELTHLLLVLLDRIDGSPKLFDQIHAQLLLTGVFHHPLTIGHTVKCLARLPSLPSPGHPPLYRPRGVCTNTVLCALLASGGPATTLQFYSHFIPKGIIHVSL